MERYGVEDEIEYLQKKVKLMENFVRPWELTAIDRILKLKEKEHGINKSTKT